MEKRYKNFIILISNRLHVDINIIFNLISYYVY